MTTSGPLSLLTIPTVNLNGTSRETLRAQYERASDALLEATVALAGMSPHPRDYYPAGEGAFERAQAEHGVRMATLRALRAEVNALWERFEGVRPTGAPPPPPCRFCKLADVPPTENCPGRASSTGPCVYDTPEKP